MIGVYKIQSKVKPERVYIGSSKDVFGRLKLHFYDFKNNRHHSLKFQRHVNKYGLDDLEFSIICSCNQESLLEIEQFYIDAYNPYFNIRTIAHSNLGIKMTEEARENMSKAQRGIKRAKMSDEVRLKHSLANKGKSVGRKASEETKLKMSKAHKGKRVNLGRKASDETRAKLSALRMGNQNGKFLKGIKRSEETKKRMRESLLRQWQDGRRRRKRINDNNLKTI